MTDIIFDQEVWRQDVRIAISEDLSYSSRDFLRSIT